MRRVSRLAIVAAVLIAPLVGLAALDSTTPASGVASPTPNASGAQEFDSTTFELTVAENGSARFAVVYERRLANESEETQFREYAQRFENQSTTLSENFESRANALVAAGRNATGRSMTAGNFQRDARVEERFNTLGVVELSFQWTGFAPVRDDGTVVVGDVFEGGIYLASNQAFVVRHGDGVRFQSVAPDGTPSGDDLASSDTVTWTGERQFSDNRPRVVLAPVGTGTEQPTDPGGTGTEPGGDGTDGTEPGIGDGEDLGVLPMLGLGLVAVLLLAFAYREYGDGVLAGGSSDGATGGRGATDGPADPGAAGGGASAGEQAGDGASTPAVTEEELLTDEDRVRSLLEEHGGRMRQVNIVEETDWSKSKVSMLLSDMEEAGTITKLRVGRENIVSLDGHEPDLAGSPFDEADDEAGEAPDAESDGEDA
jgi:hypothetical protein